MARCNRHCRTGERGARTRVVRFRLVFPSRPSCTYIHRVQASACLLLYSVSTSSTPPRPRCRFETGAPGWTTTTNASWDGAGAESRGWTTTQAEGATDGAEGDS